ALAELLAAEAERRPVIWASDGLRRACAAEPPAWAKQVPVVRRFDPRPRLVVLGSDPTAIAIAQLGAQAEFETTLVRPKGPPPPPRGPGGAARRRRRRTRSQATSPDRDRGAPRPRRPRSSASPASNARAGRSRRAVARGGR